MLRILSIALFVALGLTFLSGMAFSQTFGKPIGVVFSGSANPTNAHPLVKVAPGLNAVWLDGPSTQWPNDVELGATASASFSPHFSLVGGAFRGIENRYNRFDFGPRATITDADNKDFNGFLGIRYRGGSKDAVNPNEWAPDAGFGWTPFVSMPRFKVVADAGYGLKSNRVLALLGVRYAIPLNK